MKSPRLTKTGGIYDLKLTDGKFEWAEDGIQVAQNFIQRFLTNVGEYSLNGYLTGKDSKGTKIYEILFNHSRSKAEKIFEISRVIQSTPGFKAFLSQIQFSQTGRELSINASIQTEWGAITIGNTVDYL